MPDRANDAPAAATKGTLAANHAGSATAAPAPAEAERAGTLAAGYGYASLQAAAAAQPPPFRLTPAGLIALQRAVGNRAVAAAFERAVQRVPVTVGGSETLYNQDAPGGQAGAASYGGSNTYQLTRDGNAGVNVEVRIKFLRQTRNTMRPRRNTDPDVGQLTGPQTELPVGDRAWATTTAAAAVGHWNGRLTLVGKDQPAPDAAEVDKRLPVNFRATPVFGLADPADTTVIVHPPGVTGGARGHPIDAGNYYMKKDDSIYPETNDMIYAHEYGHLLGINDEYSQSNEQMNLLLHRAAPMDAIGNLAMGLLDRRTLELMALATLSRPLYAQLQSTMPLITNAVRAQQAAVRLKMIAAAREGVRHDIVRDALTARLEQMSEARLHARIPRAVATQTTTNFSHATVATRGVDRIFSPRAISTRVGDTYWNALLAPQSQNVEVPSFGATRINVQESIFSAGAQRGALRTAVRGEASGIVGARPRPGLPALPAPATLTGQLMAAPATWSAAGSALETGITPDRFAAVMAITLVTAGLAAALPPPPGAAAPRPSIRSGRALYERAWVLVNNAANEAVRALTTELVGGTLDPVLQNSVAALRTAIADEVTRVMTMSPAELAANPSPDPNMAAIVTDMKRRLDASKTALRGTGMDPLGVAGATTPAQDVTYSYQGMMGSGRTTAMRPDQFQPLTDNFNTRLKYPTERNFRPEVR